MSMDWKLADRYAFVKQPDKHEINDIITERNLSLKLCAIASPIANRTPDERLRLNGFRPLFAGETAEKGARDFFCHNANLRNILRLNIRSHRAPRDPPSSVVASQLS